MKGAAPPFLDCERDTAETRGSLSHTWERENEGLPLPFTGEGGVRAGRDGEGWFPGFGIPDTCRRMSDLTRLSARQMVRLLKRREVSPAEAIAAALARIAATDPAINALPTLCADRAKAHAERIAAGSGETDHPAWLAGLPIAVKDLNDVQGVRTT